MVSHILWDLCQTAVVGSLCQDRCQGIEDGTEAKNYLWVHTPVLPISYLIPLPRGPQYISEEPSREQGNFQYSK